jgi:hypothetical protein
MLAWKNGDPSRPFVDLWKSGADFLELSFDSGKQPIARAGDTVSITLMPVLHQFAATSPTLGPFTFTPALPLTVVGTILTGAAKVKA